MCCLYRMSMRFHGPLPSKSSTTAPSQPKSRSEASSITTASSGNIAASSGRIPKPLTMMASLALSDQSIYEMGKPTAKCSTRAGTVALVCRRWTTMVTKISSFSHKDYNQPYVTHRGRLLNADRYGLDMFERPNEIYDRINDNPDVPTYLK